MSLIYSEIRDALILITGNLMEKLTMTQRLYKNLMPDLNKFNCDELKFCSFYMSVEKVGGDLFDIIRVGKNGYGIVMADATGHGFPAFLLSSMAKVSFTNHSGWGINPSKVCENVNRDFFQFVGDMPYFLTAFYGIINLESGYLYYSNAGHMPPIMYKKSEGKAYELLGARNPPLGIYIPRVDFAHDKVSLSSGDRLFLYTDGITESANKSGEIYGRERLIRLVDSYGSKKVKDFKEAFKSDLNDFCDGCDQKDDRTLLCIEFLKKVDVVK